MSRAAGGQQSGYPLVDCLVSRAQQWSLPLSESNTLSPFLLGISIIRIVSPYAVVILPSTPVCLPISAAAECICFSTRAGPFFRVALSVEA